jgi:hypothetical protein
MNPKNDTRPVGIPPGTHTTGELAFPALSSLIKANEAARAKRLRNLRAVHYRQREIEALQRQQGGPA